MHLISQLQLFMVDIVGEGDFVVELENAIRRGWNTFACV